MQKYEEDESDRLMREWIEEEDCLIKSILESTPENRKDWSLDEWVYALFRSSGGLIYESDCPIDQFSPEQWRDIIVDGSGVEAQFCPCPDEVLALMTKDDFKNWGSCRICTTLVLEGEWLAHLLPLEVIEQEDFDNLMVCDPEEYSCEEDFLALVGPRFPNNIIPDHLTWPHKGEGRKK